MKPTFSYRGAWTAKYRGQTLPVVHFDRADFDKGAYSDHHKKPGKKNDQWVAALRETKRCIVMVSKRDENGTAHLVRWHSVWDIDSLDVCDSGGAAFALTTLIERLR